MKKSFTIMAVISLAVLTMAVAVSCQKEKNDETPATQKDSYTQEAIERIMDFKQQVEFHKAHPSSRTTSFVSIEDAVWNLEALFNYTYSYPELCYGRLVTTDTALRLPVGPNDSVSMSDLTAFYEDMFATIGEVYRSVTLPDKQFVLLDVEVGERDSNGITIMLHSVQGSVVETPSNGRDPFHEGEWWYYGDNRGGWNSSEGDAAQVLTELVNLELTPTVPSVGYYCYSDIVSRFSSTPSNYPYQNPGYNVPDSYCEFEVVGNPYVADSCLIMNCDQLNFHYYGELDLVQNRLYTNGPNDLRVPFQVGISWGNEGEGVGENRTYTRAYHWTTASYGIRLLVLPGQNERRSLEP